MLPADPHRPAVAFGATDFLHPGWLATIVALWSIVAAAVVAVAFVLLAANGIPLFLLSRWLGAAAIGALGFVFGGRQV